MKILVAGMDPSFTSWGTAEGTLDLTTGFLDEVTLDIAKTEKGSAKQVRVNSDDLLRCEYLAAKAFEVGQRCKVIFVECPVGSQSANAMKSYGACVGVLGALRSQGIQVIEVTAFEVKKALTGNKNATKGEMIKAAMALYPDANWPMQTQKGVTSVVAGTAEHMADAIGAIHAGVCTPVFQNLMRILAEV